MSTRNGTCAPRSSGSRSARTDSTSSTISSARPASGGFAALDARRPGARQVVGHLPAAARGGRLPHAAGARLERAARRRAQLRAIADLSIALRPLARPTSPRASASSCTGCGWRTCRTSSPRLDEVGLTSAQACGDVWRNVVGCPLAGVTADEYFDSHPVVHDTGRQLRRQPPVLEPAAQVQGRGLELPPPLRAARDQRHRPRRRRRPGPRGRLRRVGRRRARRVGAHGPPARRAGSRVDDAVEVAGEITALFRDHGNRLKRTRARSKFLVDEWGPERFRQALEERLGRRLADGPPPAPPLAPMRDHVGFAPQREPGLYALGGATLRGRLDRREPARARRRRRAPRPAAASA